VVVTEQDREPAGDYGYDMAHEQTGRTPVREETRQERHTTARPGGTSEPGDDYGYDEAHDF
jgi:hypothetical protein